ncbi:MAG: hypothetical protein E6G66_09165 [Actinobacteria bacterium]|nr:MAG: hypothetical protein E6G66_09165 [Actinomycetota bacterium]
MANQDEEEEERPTNLPKEGESALAALRNLWGSTGRDRDFLEKSQEGSGRDTMEQIIGKVGYEDLEHFAEGEATTDTHAAGQRLSAAWKRTMEHEGVKGGNQERPPWERDED